MRSPDGAIDKWARRFVGLARLAALACFFNFTAAPRVDATEAPAPLAEVNGEAITNEEVERALGAPLRKLEEQIYQVKRQMLETMIAEKLLATEAAKRGITLQALLDSEVTAKAGAVSEQEVEAVYQASKANMSGDEATVKEQLRAQFQNQRIAARRAAFINSLRSTSSVVLLLRAPPAFKAEVVSEGAPIRGPAAAPVTIVEFSDFHCPFCKQVLPTLTQLLSRYPDTVKVAFRDFPLDASHPLARRAAEAARCARDQDKFWEYHDLLFANAPKAGPQQLNAYAEQLGLDVPKFERCLSSGVHTASVQKDLDEGIRSGVTGTPTFFINGRVLSGALRLESFVRAVEEELKRAK